MCVCTLKSRAGVTFKTPALKTQRGPNKGETDKVQRSTLGWMPPFWKEWEGMEIALPPLLPQDMAESMCKGCPYTQETVAFMRPIMKTGTSILATGNSLA